VRAFVGEEMSHRDLLDLCRLVLELPKTRDRSIKLPRKVFAEALRCMTIYRCESQSDQRINPAAYYLIGGAGTGNKSGRRYFIAVHETQFLDLTEHMNAAWEYFERLAGRCEHVDVTYDELIDDWAKTVGMPLISESAHDG
jgi:hypothetical protein